MSSAVEMAGSVLPEKPRRADARRNYEKVVAAAREAFTECGTDASLEGIARRAGVGIGTLYRNFPTRPALIEAVYVDEVEKLCSNMADVEALEPWDALTTWLRRFVGYVATKRALTEVLLADADRAQQLFTCCRTTMYGAGEPLLARAQAAGVARADVTLPDVIQLVVGVAKLPATEPGQFERLLEIVLDGLRAR